MAEMREIKATVSVLIQDTSTMSDEAVRNLLRQTLRDHIGNPTRVTEPCNCEKASDG